MSASTSLIMSCSSDSLGFWPSDRMTVPSSFVVISPDGSRVRQHHPTDSHSSVSNCRRPRCASPRRLWSRYIHSIRGSRGVTDHLHPCPVRARHRSAHAITGDYTDSEQAYKQREGLPEVGDLLLCEGVRLRWPSAPISWDPRAPCHDAMAIHPRDGRHGQDAPCFHQEEGVGIVDEEVK